MAQNINNAPAGTDRTSDNTANVLLVILAIVVVIVAAVYLIPRIRSGNTTAPNDINVHMNVPGTSTTPGSGGSTGTGSGTGSSGTGSY